MNWIATLPSTNLRIFVTILLIVATCVKVLWTWTAPPLEWLGFLALSAGLDVAQFGVKRSTFQPSGAKVDEQLGP